MPSQTRIATLWGYITGAVCRRLVGCGKLGVFACFGLVPGCGSDHVAKPSGCVGAVTRCELVDEQDQAPERPLERVILSSVDAEQALWSQPSCEQCYWQRVAPAAPDQFWFATDRGSAGDLTLLNGAGVELARYTVSPPQGLDLHDADTVRQQVVLRSLSDGRATLQRPWEGPCVDPVDPVCTWVDISLYDGQGDEPRERLVWSPAAGTLHAIARAPDDTYVALLIDAETKQPVIRRVSPAGETVWQQAMFPWAPFDEADLALSRDGGIAIAVTGAFDDSERVRTTLLELDERGNYTRITHTDDTPLSGLRVGFNSKDRVFLSGIDGEGNLRFRHRPGSDFEEWQVPRVGDVDLVMGGRPSIDAQGTTYLTVMVGGFDEPEPLVCRFPQQATPSCTRVRASSIAQGVAPLGAGKIVIPVAWTGLSAFQLP